jgi:hypothetical protein
VTVPHDRTPLFGNQQGGVLDSRPRIQQLYVVALIGPPSRAVYPLGQRADYAGLVEPPGPDQRGCHHVRSLSGISRLAVCARTSERSLKRDLPGP